VHTFLLSIFQTVGSAKPTPWFEKLEAAKTKFQPSEATEILKEESWRPS